MVTCLEFASAGEQNACWTELDAVDSSINTPGLEDIIEDGNPVAVGAKPIYVDNGTKAAVIKDIADRFNDRGKYSNNPAAAGHPRQPPGNDTWLVPLPIIECQNPGEAARAAAPQKIVGVACFDIQEVLPPPEKIIKGEFVCPGDPRLGREQVLRRLRPGGEVPTIDAQYPVLVD